MFLRGVELDQVYAVRSRMRTLKRFQSPPFHCDTEVGVRARRRKGHIEVWAKYLTLASKPAEGEDEPVGVWTVELECVATFETTEPGVRHPPDDLEAFALLVGAPAVHPYAREWTQTLSGHSQYPAFTIGLMDSIAELADDHEMELPDREPSDTA